jgi:hypothetical protein
MRQPPTSRTGRPHLRLLPPLADEPSGPATARSGGAETRDADEADHLSGEALAGEVAAVLADTTDEALANAPLALPLALSLCMERHGVDAEGLLDAMRLLRRALLASAGPQAAEAPVPLAAGDPRSAALGLAAHLHELFGWAAAMAGDDRRAVVSSAVANLAAS